MNGLFGSMDRLPGIFAPPDPREVVPNVVLPNPKAPPIVRSAQPLNVPAPAAPGRAQQMLANLGRGAGIMFGGAADSNLTDEQNKAAQQRAMMMAGLSMMAGAGERNATFGSTLAQGAMAGQQAGEGERARIYQGTQEARLRQALENPNIVGKLTPDQLAMIQLMPPMEAVKTLSSIAFASPAAPQVVADGAVLVGADGKPVFENAKDAEGTNWTPEQQIIARALDVDLNTLTPEQGQAFLGEITRLKKAGAVSVSVDTGERAFGNINELRSQFRQDIKPFETTAGAYGLVQSGMKDNTRAGDIALVYGVMKMFSPESTVQQGEFAEADQAAGVPQQVFSAYNRLVGNKTSRLGADVRATYANQAQQIAGQQQQRAQAVMRRYSSQAELVGMNPGVVIYDPFAEVGFTNEPRGIGRLGAP